jgi:hypothetical protein
MASEEIADRLIVLLLFNTCGITDEYVLMNFSVHIYHPWHNPG